MKMYKKRRMSAAVLIVLSLCAALAVFSGCSCSQTVDSPRSQEKFELNSDGMVESDPFYVLVVGSDARKGTVAYTGDPNGHGQVYTHSDAIMLVRVDPKNYKITMVSVPRDTQDEVNGAICKINESYAQGGIKELEKHVAALTGVNPKYYIETTFVGFEDLVNKLGGITMDVPFDQSMTDIVSGEEIAYPAGEQTLDGAEALVYARERHKYSDVLGLSNQEAYRQDADRNILQVMVSTLLSDPATVQSLVESLYSSVNTDWSLADLKATAADFADHADQVAFIKGTGPYDGDINPDAQIWLAYRDEDTWREIIAVVDQGGDPNEVLTAPSL